MDVCVNLHYSYICSIVSRRLFLLLVTTATKESFKILKCKDSYYKKKKQGVF